MESNINLEYLKKIIENKNVIIELKGIITTTINLKKIKIEIKEENLRIIGIDNQKIEIKTNQIMLIKKNADDVFELITDQLESLIIKL